MESEKKTLTATYEDQVFEKISNRDYKYVAIMKYAGNNKWVDWSWSISKDYLQTRVPKNIEHVKIIEVDKNY